MRKGSVAPRVTAESAIGSVSIARLDGGFRAFLWRDAPIAGNPLFILDGDTLEHALAETLRVVRGERPRSSKPTTR
jgi:hypothetical protein